MTQPSDEPGYRPRHVNASGLRAVGIGGNVTNSSIFTGDINIVVANNAHTPTDGTGYAQAQIYLSASLQASVIRIFQDGVSSKSIGLGILVDQNHLVTCADVIEQALQLQDEKAPGESDTIYLDFPLLSASQKLTAHVIQWNPSNYLAGLLITMPLPDGAKPAILKANKDIWGDSYQAFGFPEGAEMGAWAFGTIIGPQSGGQAQIKANLEKTGKAISLGFSGSPIWDTRLQAVVGMIRHVDTTPGSTTASMLTIDAMQACWSLLHDMLQPRRPYRSLEIFKIEHADFFFGRDAMISKLQKKLQQVNFLALVGSSGSGKSSLVQAGLIPTLLHDNPNLVPVIFRPGSTPTKNLVSILAEVLEPDLPAIERLSKINLLLDLITSKPITILDVMASLNQKNPGCSFLLVIDQFEEIFAASVLKQDQQQFIEMLLLINKQIEDLKILITLRADFFGSVLSQPGLGKIVDAGQVNVLPMTRDELQAAIAEPVKLVGGSFEGGLVERIVSEVVDQPGNLPHLQFALAHLWDSRTSDNRITYAAYEETGGVQGAIARRADEEFLHLQSQGKGEIVRRVFTRLVVPDEEGRDTRRRADREQIEMSKGNIPDSAWQVVQVLSNSRLLVTDRDPITGEETVEVAHEALIRNWRRLREWVDSKRAFYIWRQARLAPNLENWQRSKDDFLDEEELVGAKRWLAEQREELSHEEIEYIYHSLLRSENTDLAAWLAGFGTQEDVFRFLTPYWDTSETEKRTIGVKALASLPKSAQEEAILEKLLRFALKDPALEVATAAAHGLCQRGQIVRLVDILNEDPGEPKLRERLIKILASTRNLPEIGSQVLQTLRKHRRQVQIEAAILLVQQYRNELALAFAVTFLVGLLGGIANSVIIQLLSQAYTLIVDAGPSDPFSIFTFGVGSTDIMLVLLFGLFVTIQVRLVDKQPLHRGHFTIAVQAVMAYTWLFIVLGWTGFIKGIPLASLSDILGRNIPEVLATLTFAETLVHGIFSRSLFPERRQIWEQSMSVAIQATGRSMLTYAGIALPFVAFTMLWNSNSLDYLNSGMASSYIMYALGISVSGFLAFLSTCLRIFIYLAGFYWGLQLAFQESVVKEKLSNGV